MDETEIRNVDYLEYLYWLGRVYGTDFPEVVKKAQPDQLVWRNELSYNEDISEFYLHHPAYKDYPVVGVNWIQANDYCAWRTDRVNEDILVQLGILEINPDQTNENNFNTDAYLAGQYQPLPFELQIGMSQKLKHIPLRFSELLTNLQKWDLTYTDPTDPANIPDPITGQVTAKSGAGKVADEVMRHIVLGAELTIAKVLAIRIGYNYQRRQELKVYDKAGLTGFSIGAGLHVKMFNLSYTRASYTAGIPMNYITVGVNLQEFVKKQ